MTSQLYLLTPPAIDLAIFPDLLSAALDTGHVPALQVRLKDLDDAELRRTLERLLPIAQAADCALILNDRADLAAQMGCDGVHLGQEDGSIADARDLLGFEREVGVTCHNSKHLAFEAGEAGADYVAFGAFFPTHTKAVTHRAGAHLLEDWAAISELPCVAIGGITAANCGPLVQAGADFLAVSAAVWDHADGPAAGVNALAHAISEATATLARTPSPG